MFRISSSRSQSKIPSFKSQNLKFQIPSSKFQVSKIKSFSQELQKSIKVFLAKNDEKIQIKKEQMKITQLKNRGMTKPSSFKD